jgi:hypothetical protein
MKSPSKPRKKASRRPRAERNYTLRHATPPQPMDVDETFFAEEPAMPTSVKDVRQPACSSLMNLTYPPSLSTPTLKNLFQRLAPTYVASSILRAFRRQLHAGAASPLHLSGGALTAFLQLCSARSAAKSRTSCFPFTGSKNGWENTLRHRSCGKLGCTCNLGTLGIHAHIKLCAIKLFML